MGRAGECGGYRHPPGSHIWRGRTSAGLGTVLRGACLSNVPGGWVLIAIFLLANGLGSGIGVRAENATPLLEAVRARYEDTMQGVEAGEISREVGGKARARWLALRKALIALDARIETSKLELEACQGKGQRDALNALADTSLERERILVEALQDLDRLSDAPRATNHPLSKRPRGTHTETTSGTAGAAPEADRRHGSPDKAATGSAASRSKVEIKEYDIEIEMSPEDVTKGDME